MEKTHIKNITKCAQEKRILIQKNSKRHWQPSIFPYRHARYDSISLRTKKCFKQHLQTRSTRSPNPFTFPIREWGRLLFYILLHESRKTTIFAKTHRGVRLSDDTVTEKPAEIRNHVHSFYKDLYSHVSTTKPAQNYLLKDIPSLDPADSETCERPISIDELNQAVKTSQQKQNSRSRWPHQLILPMFLAPPQRRPS